jgi:hypothetical protein
MKDYSVNHALCPPGSHHRVKRNPKAVTFHCSVTGTNKVYRRCPAMTLENEHCPNAIWSDDYMTCRVHGLVRLEEVWR